MPKTYNELYFALRQRLREEATPGYSLEARLLLACAAGKTQEQLLRDMQLYSSDQVEQQARALVDRRLAGEPCAYITGTWGFYGLEFQVDRNVLIPRMDTEALVTAALEQISGKSGDVRVLDLCTGSGCVGCAIARNRQDSRVVLLDRSPAALSIAQENLRALGLETRVSCVSADVTEPPPRELGSFDLIVGNPPYIPTGELETLDVSVRDYEPLSALDGGVDGLDLYRAILKQYGTVLRPSGHLLLEVGEGQADAVLKLFRFSGFRNLGTVKDTLGWERVVFGRR